MGGNRKERRDVTMNESVLRGVRRRACKLIGVMAICTMTIAVAGCGALPGSSSTPSDAVAASSGDSTLDSAVRQIYTKDYTYTKTSVSTYDEETVTVVSQGVVSQSPYREHVKVMSSSSQIWDEAYFYDNGSALLHTQSGWQKTRSNRSYPYGHNRKLDVTGTDTNGDVRTYSTRYTENVGKGYGIDDLIATLTQTYRIDTDGNLLSIETDLSDLNRVTEIANAMSANGEDRAEAESNAGAAEDHASKETLEIHDLGVTQSIEIPKV